MKTQIIEFIESRECRTFAAIPDAFSLRDDRPAKWLQRICIWTLRKLGCYYQKEVVTFTRHILDADVFMERLFRQKEELVVRFNAKPSRLLIGADDYMELMNSPEIRHQFTFNAEYHVNRTVYGLTVEVIPWMRGILVMPK